MTRSSMNLILDISLLVVFLTAVWIDFVLRFVFPPGTLAAGYSLWGSGYDQWFEAQFWMNCLLLLGLLIHVMLHWSWVCGIIGNRVSRMLGRTVRADEGAQTIYGVAVLIVFATVLGIALTVAYLSLRAPQV